MTQEELAKTLGVSVEALAKMLPCYEESCSGHFVPRHGKFGLFFGCSRYPWCKASRSNINVQRELRFEIFGDADDENGLPHE